MSMAVSLEVRVPILDHRVVELGFRLPPSLRLKGRTGKYLLKKLLCRYVPAELVYRPKQGFGIPLGLWFRGELRPLVEDLLSEPALRRIGVFNPPVVRRMYEMHQSGARNFEAKLWRILVVHIWANAAGVTSGKVALAGRTEAS
jgi:asparagine synthase (glutamine-hydrolysing)